jgi:hypothetical protein
VNLNRQRTNSYQIEVKAPRRTGPNEPPRDLVVGMRIEFEGGERGIPGLRSVCATMLAVMREIAVPAAGSEPATVAVNAYFPGVTLRGESFRTTSDDQLLDHTIAGIGDRYYDIAIKFKDCVHLSISYSMWSGDLSEAVMGFYRECTPEMAEIEPIAQRLADLLIEVGGTVGVRSGFVNADTKGANSYSPATFSHLAGLAPDMTLHVPGYHWCLLLGPGHVDALGGLDRVRVEAPVYQVRDAVGPVTPTVVAQLTAEIGDRTLEQVKAWRSYLLSILRPAVPVGDFSEPQLLFEGDAISEDVEEAIEHRNKPESSSMQVATSGTPLPGKKADFRLITEPLDDTELGQLVSIVNAWRIAGQNGGFHDDWDHEHRTWRKISRIGSVSDIDVTQAKHEWIFRWTVDLADGPDTIENLASGFHGRVHELGNQGYDSPYRRLEIDTVV